MTRGWPTPADATQPPCLRLREHLGKGGGKTSSSQGARMSAERATVFSVYDRQAAARKSQQMLPKQDLCTMRPVDRSVWMGESHKAHPRGRAYRRSTDAGRVPQRMNPK